MRFPTIGTILSITTAVILILVAMGIFNQPDIVDVRQTGQSVCPQTVSSTFDLTFSNIGNNEARVKVKVRSNVVEFSDAEDTIIVPPSTEPVRLSFDVLNKQFPPREAFVDYEWSYNKYWFFPQGGEQRCIYDRDSTSPTTLVLVR